MNQITEKEVLFLQYGKQVFPIENIKQASEMWDKVRRESVQNGFGPDDMKSTPYIIDGNGKKLGYVSWNGRVWKGLKKAHGQEWI